MTSHLRPLILTALLALALLVPASAGAATERTISVTANATLKVPNDSAGLGLAVSREKSTRAAALRAVAAGLRSVIAVAQDTPGVGPGDITTGRISVRKSFRGTHPNYRASAGISVTLHQPDKAGELVSGAIGAGRPASGDRTSSSATPKPPSPAPSRRPSTRPRCAPARWQPRLAARSGRHCRSTKAKALRSRRSLTPRPSRARPAGSRPRARARQARPRRPRPRSDAPPPRRRSNPARRR